MNRRQFIITGPVTLAAGLWAATSGAGRPAAGLRAAIFDTRFPRAREFSRTARGLGLPVYGFEGDVTALWAERLQGLWRARGGAVAGLTSASALQCLEEMARDHWHRVAVRIEHTPTADGRVRHVLHAREPRFTETCDLVGGRDPWAGAAQAVLRYHHPLRGAMRSAAYTANACVRQPAAPPLVSWVISRRIG